MMTHRRRMTSRRLGMRRSFTLVELIVAGVITSFIMGTISMSLANLARSKISSRLRLEAHLRADSALEIMRRDIVSIIRSDDLFWTRFYLTDSYADTPAGRMDRDELLFFNNRLRPVRSSEYQGEGSEYETQYRIEDDDYGPKLWQRRDPLPDKYPFGGGVATPVVESIVSLKFEAYDGFQWHDEWDSDSEGLPLAVRITVVASGDYGYEDVFDAPFATLRTIVSIDRILLPRENLVALLDLENQENEDEENADGVPSLEDLGIESDLFPGGFGPNGQLPAGFQPGDGLFRIDDGILPIPNTNDRRTLNGGRGPRDSQLGGDPPPPLLIRPGTTPSSTGGTRGQNAGGVSN